MPTPTLLATAYGRPATERLHARIAAAKAEDPLRPVTVVVPANSVGVSARRLLAGGALGPVAPRGDGIIGLTLLTVYRLAELLGAASLAGSGRRPVSTPLIAAAVRTALAEEPGIFAPVAGHPSTEEALVRAYRELSELDEDRLDALAATGPRAAEVVRLRRAVRDRLVDDWFEEADLMGSARTAVEAGSSVVADLGTIIVHLPQALTPAAAALLRSLAARTPVEVIAARTGAADADADVELALRRLGIDPPPAEPAAPAATAVVSVSDAEEEVRTAVERIVAAARAGTPLEAMAVLYPADRPYARLAAAQLDAAGIPWNGRAVRPLSDRVLGRWLLDLLALPEQRVARPAVLGLLGGAPMRTADGRPIPLAAWERASREAGIVRDRSEWRAKLPRLARDLRARADAAAAEEEPREWVVHRSRAGADATEGLAAFVDELFGALDEAAAVGTWSGLAAWCAGAVRRFLGGEASRATWPEDERRAADRVEEALDRLAGLDEVEGATTLPVFRRTLELELDDDLGRTGALGRGVLVGTPSQALGVDLALVVVLGLAEGVLPTRPREDSLLPDSDRAVVGDVLQPRSARTGVEHRHLLAALAAASGERVLVFPRGDLRRSVERTPSRWLLDAVEALGADARELPDTAPWLEVVPSFAARVRAAAFPATRQEYGLRALADVGPADLPDHPLVVADTVLARGAELARNRGVAGFTRFDGNLSDLAGSISSPAEDGRPTSTSRIEAWLSCPHAYLVRHVLGVEPVENPEELLEMTALDRGTLVHEVLERWLRGELALEVPHSGTPWSPAARDRLRAIAAEVLDAAEARGLTGHPLLWRRDRRLLGIDLERFVDADDERRRRDGLTPIGAEQPFGLPDSGTDPVEIDLGDGRSVRIRGQIDRLDRAADGTLVVADYKTGGTSSYAGLGPDQPLGGDGTKLQLAVYALAMRAAQDADAVRSEYWFTSAKGEFKRLGYVLDDAVESALRRALRVAVDGIAAGHFPMKPPEPAFRVFTVCAYCDPDDLGTADRFRDWERIRTDDALRGYVGYIDPDALDEQEDR